jgi:filamentous hemagglutinin family protein
MKNDKAVTKKYSRILALNIGLTLTSTVAFAAQGPAVFFGTAINNMLPKPLPTVLPTGFAPVTGLAGISVGTVQDDGKIYEKMTVHQNEDKAIASWESFNIGENGWVYFDQQGHADWQALNRIYDRNPSQIFGKLTADGQVYLINQNGILFGGTADVNVHSLVASSLNLADDDFLTLTNSSEITLDGTGNYDPENQPDWQPGTSSVHNRGFISVELVREENGESTVIRDGSVFLVAPNAGNSGTIVAPFGQIGLAAGNRVTLTRETDSTYQNEKYVSRIDTPGRAVNEEGGILAADNGRVGMYGRVVNQEGMIRSVTSVWHRGAIELRATERVVTGRNSTTLAPVTTSEEKTGEDFRHRPGEITIGGIGRSGEPTGVVEHNGTIAADAGEVKIYATDRAYFGAGSTIDVSGAWSGREGSDQWHTQEMNTAQLKDDQQQKDVDSLLYRSEVTVNELFGSTIGDFNETYGADRMTSLQKASRGGSIRVEATGVTAPEGDHISGGDIIVREGALFDISGGGHHHGESTGVGTKLLFGNRIYDLDEAPASLPYEAFADVYEKEHARYGITESYRGLYAGGALPLYDRIPAYLEGHDAGTLTLIGRNLVFDGSLAAHATVGPYQIYDAGLFDEDGIMELDGKQFTERLRRPLAGTLQIGGDATNQGGNTDNNVLGELIIEKTVAPLAEDFTADTPRDADAPSRLSAGAVNAAGLGTFTVKANRQIIVADDAEISLAAGGALHFEARRIEHRGAIDIAAGAVTMALSHNYSSVNIAGNPWYAEVNERLILSGASRISTAGERVDQVDALAAGAAPATGVQTGGGSISLRDLTHNFYQNFDDFYYLGQGDGVVLAKGALLDVSGGYEITADGRVQAGDAGALFISGSNVVLDGEVRGHSLEGAKGGSLAIYANNIRVEKEGPELTAALEDASGPLPLLDFGHSPDGGYPNEQQLHQFSKGLVLADNRFARTGFSGISLNSIYDFVIAEGVQLGVSLTREAAPVAAGAVAGAARFVETPADDAGAAALTLTAGGNLDGMEDFDADYPEYDEDRRQADLVLPAGSGISLPKGGSVMLKAPQVTIGGRIAAPAGAIRIAATNGDLVVAGTASLSAAGHISTVGREMVENLAPVHEVWGAGAITLENGSAGGLTVEEGALVDVSGTAETIVSYAVDGTAARPVTGAGRAGSITLAARGPMSIAPHTLRGEAHFPGMINGALTIERNSGPGYVVEDHLLDIFRNNDFYQWRLAGSNSLIFDHDLSLDHDGVIIVDTPLLASSNDAVVEISADWLRLDNSYQPTSSRPAAGNGAFALAGGALDLRGAVAVSGAALVTLTSASEMALSDRLYKGSGLAADNFYSGGLRCAADLTLTADRIYPTTASLFTIATDKTITILPGSHPAGNMLYSAAGSLALAANRIDHQGWLAAPLGSITLTGTGENSRVMLSPGSVTSVAGMDGMVAFGDLNDTGEFWTYEPKNAVGRSADVTGAPVKKLTLEADEVIVRENAAVDLSGGGAIFGYQFLPGLEGTIDPLVRDGQYLVVPGLELPGEVVRISAGGGLAAGTYTLLPLDAAHAENARYAFLPGARVLIDQGSFTGNMPAQTAEGYAMVSGFTGVRGREIDTRAARGFALRTATEVLGEGEYATRTLTGGDGGSFELVGRQTTVTAILEGAIRAMALEGHRGGTFTAAAQSVEIGPDSFGLDEGFSINDELPAELQGKLNIKDTTFSGNGFSGIVVGDAAITRSILLRPDSTISAENVAFNAGEGGEIEVAGGAEIHAVQPAAGGSGSSEAVFTTGAGGGITLAAGSLVHAADNIVLDTDNIDLQEADTLQVDHSTLTLKSSRIVFSEAERPAGESGLFLTEAHWENFANIEDISLNSATDILFAGDFSLVAREHLVFDAQRIGGYALAGDYAAVTIAAPRLTLTNTKFAYEDSDNRQWLPGVTELAMADSGAANFLTLQGLEGITLGPGDVRVAGFRAVNLQTGGALALTGQGQGRDAGNNSIVIASAFRAAGDMNISAARLKLDPMDNGAYKAADYVLRAEEAVRILPAAGAESGAAALHCGGGLRVEGRTIDHQGLIDTVSGAISLHADAVTVGGTIRSAGSADTAAGSITIEAADSFNLAPGGVLDVSAGGQGDAGALMIDAPHAENFTLAGILLGTARNGGAAGSFALDVKNLSGAGNSTGFDALSGMLAAGGFSGSLDIRSREGNISLGADKTVIAESFKLAADGNAVTGQPESSTGNIDISGTIDAAGEEGGGIELYAGSDLTLHSGSRLLATATAGSGAGGEVFLSAAAGTGAAPGYIRMAEGSVIDVSGGEEGEGGGVSFRAQRTAANDDVKMELAGTVIGADSITAEGVGLHAYTQIGAAEQAAMKNLATSYAGKVKALSLNTPGVKGVFDHLVTQNVAAGALHHRAGIEVRSNADLTVGTAWNLTNWLGIGAEPVNLTLRAAGNLNIKANIYDKPTWTAKMVSMKYQYNLEEEADLPSADLNLVAGAKTAAADFMAVSQDDTRGFLTIDDARKVYTETGDIRFASASDTTIGTAAAVNKDYDPFAWLQGKLASTLGSYRGDVLGAAGRNLLVRGAVQTATGDIDIRAGSDIRLGSGDSLAGALRTTGVPQSYEVTYLDKPGGNVVSYPTANYTNAGIEKFFDYSGGGSITVSSGGDITGGVVKSGRNWDAWWDSEKKWSAAFAQGDGGTLGIAAMAGGDVQISAAGDINTQLGTFGKGDLTVGSGSDLTGRFLAAEGRADLYAQGSFGSMPPDAQDVLDSARFAYAQAELMDASLSLVAEGDVFLGTVLNPSYAKTMSAKSALLMGYSPASSVSLQAVQGDVTMYGESSYAVSYNNQTYAVDDGAKNTLPASLAVEAGRDIIFAMAGQLVLSPAADGDLSLRAGRDIAGTFFDEETGYPQPAQIVMNQSDPAGWYGLPAAELGSAAPALPLHSGDTVPVRVTAGGNIENVRLQTAKKTEITAGRDILDLELRAQNIAARDLSFVRAGGNIVMGSYERPEASQAFTGFRFAGPGEAVVQAGGAISLGTTEGIRSVANGPEGENSAWEEGTHPALAFAGADLYVLSGMADLAPAEVKGFFDAIRACNREISQLVAEDRTEEAKKVEERARQELFLPLFGTAYPELDAGAGISMTQSKIASLYGGDVNILSAGAMDVGRSMIMSAEYLKEKGYADEEIEDIINRSKNSGIKTEFGGNINIFAVGDVNVNESRIMTWMGDDITVWSEEDINAGRGSKTAVNASGAAVPRLNERGVAELFKKPSVGGSGIRAITYDPDGPNGPRRMPEAGDIYLFARGTIDAGEAGIVGNSIYLAAAKVVNAQNISFSQSGVGVPVQSGATVDVGAISGAGAIMAATMAVPSAAGLGDTQERALQNLSELNEVLVPQELKVEIIDLQENL